MKKFNNLCFIGIFIILSLIKCIYAINVTSIENDSEDKFYLIFVENEYNEDRHNKRQEVSDSVYDLIHDIHNLIMNNTDTFQNPSKLYEIEENNKLKKRNEEIIYLLDHGDSDIVYPISSNKNKTVVYAYLSTTLANKVKSYPQVKACIADRKLKHYNAIEILDEQPIDINEQLKGIDEQPIDIDKQQIEMDIKNETKWKGVSFRENADLHLSLISQGKFNQKINNKYDSTYYYPSTAGQGVDLYVVDSGFDFRHPEYSNKDEREAKCLYYIERGGLFASPHEDYCHGKLEYGHGLSSSDVAAGLTHGVASKVNIYGIVIDEWTSNTFVVLQYIKENRLRPNKTVFNFSIGDYFNTETDKELIDYWEGLIDSVTEEGAIIVSAAGNNNVDAGNFELNNKMYPCSFNNVICAGGIDNYGYNGIDSDDIPETKIMNTKYYRKADFSNFGENVDIFAPSYVVVEYKENNGTFSRHVHYGTSFSSPIVAGVVTSLISEHSNTTFNTETMRQFLWELGEKDIIDDIPEGTPNVFINNGKHIVYPGNEDEESEIEVEEDYDQQKNYNDSESDSDDEEQNIQEPASNEYPSEISSSYDDNNEYPSEYEEPTDSIYNFEKHEWDFKWLVNKYNMFK